MKNSPLIEIFDDPAVLKNVTNIYLYLKNANELQLNHELESNKDLLDDLNEQSAAALLSITQMDTLKELHDNEIISSKLFILLKKKIDKG
jgi:CPA1 family monovalent cation:H+ antiporter